MCLVGNWSNYVQTCSLFLRRKKKPSHECEELSLIRSPVFFVICRHIKQVLGILRIHSALLPQSCFVLWACCAYIEPALVVELLYFLCVRLLLHIVMRKPERM